MRIVFDVSYIQHVRTGIGRVSLELLRALQDANRRHTVVLFGWSWSLDRALISSLRARGGVDRTARIPGQIKRLFWNRLSFPPVEMFTGRLDLFQSADPFLPPVRKGVKVSIVYDLAQRRFPVFFPPYVLRMDARLDRALSKADIIIVPSASTRNDLVELAGVDAARIRQIALPVARAYSAKESEVRTPDPLALGQSDAPFFLFVGRWEPRKNIIGIIHAFEWVCRKTKVSCDLILAGAKGWKYGDVEQAIATSRVSHRIHAPGYLSDMQLAVLYRDAVAVVYPSWYEGFGLPVLEAMTCGTPVVTSRNSSLGEVGGNAALYADPASPASIGQAMAALLTDPAERSARARLSRAQAERITARDAGKDLLTLYEEIGE